jgi:hypothetical protein
LICSAIVDNRGGQQEHLDPRELITAISKRVALGSEKTSLPMIYRIKI